MSEQGSQAESRAEQAYKIAQDRIVQAARKKENTLDLSIEGLTTLPPEIATLTALEVLDLARTQVSDITPITHLTALEDLSLADTQVNDIAPIANLIALKGLNLTDTPVSDIAPVANLTAMKFLSISRTPVSDIAPILNLTTLETLFLSYTRVSDVTPVANLTALNEFYLTETEVSDLRPILNCRSLLSKSENAGLYFWGSKACELDPSLAELSDISDDHERTQKTFDYLATLSPWPAPLPWEIEQAQKSTYSKEVLSVEAVINAQDSGGWVFSPYQHLLKFHISDAPLAERQVQLAKVAGERQKDLVHKIGQNNALGLKKEVLDEANRFGDILSDNSRTLNDRSLELWGSLIALGGLLEGNEIARVEGRDPLDLLTVEIRAALQTLIAIASGLVRSFPEAEALDNDLNTFNRNSVSPALILALLEKALNAKLIDGKSAALMQHVEAQSQGIGVQAQKAEKVSVKGVKNLLLTAGLLTTAAVGTTAAIAIDTIITDIFTDISNHYELGEQSIELIEAARAYITAAEPEIEQFLNQLPADERASIMVKIEDLKSGPDRL